MSTGRIIFSILFVLVFGVVLFFQYRGQREFHRKYFKGAWWVIVAFALFVLLLFAFKYFLTATA